MSQLEYNPRTREWERTGEKPQPARSEDPAIEHIMPFGKYEGLKLDEVPTHYLSWLLRETDIKGDLREAVAAELKQR